MEKQEGGEFPGDPTDIRGNPSTIQQILRGLGLQWPRSHDTEN